MVPASRASSGWPRSCDRPRPGSPGAPPAPTPPPRSPSWLVSSAADENDPTGRQIPLVDTDPATCTESTARPCAYDTVADGSLPAPRPAGTAPREPLPCSGTASKTSWVHSIRVFTMSPNVRSLSPRSVHPPGGGEEHELAERKPQPGPAPCTPV